MFVPELVTFKVSGNASFSKALRIAFVPPAEIKPPPPATGISDNYANDHGQCDRQHWILLKIFQTSFYTEYWCFMLKGEVPVLNEVSSYEDVWERGDIAPRITNLDAEWR